MLVSTELSEHAAGLEQNVGTGVWRKKPLVWVNRHRLSGVDTVKIAVLQLLAKQQGSTVASIDVEPNVMLSTHFGDRVYIVNRSRATVTRNCNYHEGSRV